MIIDEIHLLHDTRGPVLESIVARYVSCLLAAAVLVCSRSASRFCVSLCLRCSVPFRCVVCAVLCDAFAFWVLLSARIAPLPS